MDYGCEAIELLSVFFIKFKVLWFKVVDFRVTLIFNICGDFETNTFDYPQERR